VCLAVPARILSIEGTDAVVDMDGVQRAASLALTPEAKVGDYVLLHAGFAIHLIDEQLARETLELLERMADEVC
jgi:hydrogenase expression/formation protein HypC